MEPWPRLFSASSPMAYQAGPQVARLMAARASASASAAAAVAADWSWPALSWLLALLLPCASWTGLQAG